MICWLCTCGSDNEWMLFIFKPASLNATFISSNFPNHPQSWMKQLTGASIWMFTPKVYLYLWTWTSVNQCYITVYFGTLHRIVKLTSTIFCARRFRKGNEPLAAGKIMFVCSEYSIHHLRIIPGKPIHKQILNPICLTGHGIDEEQWSSIIKSEEGLEGSSMQPVNNSC